METISRALSRFKREGGREKFIEGCLDRIREPNGQGERAFLKVYAAESLSDARRYDEWQSQARALPPYAGIPVSIKDLFDVKGDATPSGSTFLRNAAPAESDAAAVSRLREAGFIPIGRTNMTEFAFSGLGLNPHFGTPLSPYDRANARISGGSTSGGAVSVADGMATVALGTDTGGSCRIPAALCGLVGFKPTASRILMDGVAPLSPSQDSVGSIGRSVACVAAVDAVLSKQKLMLEAADIAGARLGLPMQYVTDDMDGPTQTAFSRILTLLSDKGVVIVDVPIPELSEIPNINAKGGFPAVEAYKFHSAWIDVHAEEYDQRVLTRILRGKQQTEQDYAALKETRKRLITAVAERTRNVDALIMPTVPLVAPLLKTLEDDDEFTRINLLMLRNPTVVNMLDRCAISLPCHLQGEAPVGFSLVGDHNQDQQLLLLAFNIERVVIDPRQ